MYGPIGMENSKEKLPSEVDWTLKFLKVIRLVSLSPNRTVSCELALYTSPWSVTFCPMSPIVGLKAVICGLIVNRSVLLFWEVLPLTRIDLVPPICFKITKVATNSPSPVAVAKMDWLPKSTPISSFGPKLVPRRVTISPIFASLSELSRSVASSFPSELSVITKEGCPTNGAKVNVSDTVLVDICPITLTTIEPSAWSAAIKVVSNVASEEVFAVMTCSPN